MDDNNDFSKAFEQLQQMLSDSEGQSQIQNILGMLTAGDSSTPAVQPQSPLETQGIDLNMIAKISGIMQAMNNPENNAKSAFLESLKPFLKESRRKKLDQATKIIKLASVFRALKENGEGGV